MSSSKPEISPVQTPRSDGAIQHLKSLETRRFPIEHLKALAPTGGENQWLQKMWEFLEHEYTAHQTELHVTNVQLEKSVKAGLEALQQVEQWQKRAALAEAQVQELRTASASKQGELQKTLEEAASQNESVQSRVEELSQELAGKGVESIELENLLGKTKESHENELAKLQAEMEEIKAASNAQIGELNEEMRELRESLEKSKGETKQAREESAGATDEIQNLKYKIAEMQKQLNQYKVLDREFERMRKKTAETKDALF